MSGELRLLSYNVRSLRDDAAAVAGIIRACAPDVVCIQEAPRLLRWRSKCAALARESGLVVVTGGRPAAGNLLLCRLAVDVRATREVLLSKHRGRHQRGVAVARLRLAALELAVAGTHLGLDGAERVTHAGEVLDLLASYDAPIVLAADVNEEPGGPAWSMLAARYPAADAVGATFPASNPRRRIDGVFADPRWTVASAAAVDGPAVTAASDHRPVLAVLRVATSVV